MRAVGPAISTAALSIRVDPPAKVSGYVITDVPVADLVIGIPSRAPAWTISTGQHNTIGCVRMAADPASLSAVMGLGGLFVSEQPRGFVGVHLWRRGQGHAVGFAFQRHARAGAGRCASRCIP